MKNPAHDAAATLAQSHSETSAGGFDLSAVLHNPETWLIVAFVLFIGIFVKLVLPMILSALDKRSDAIRFQLEQANRLRAQAEALLASYQAARAEKEKEAEAIIADAKRDADALRARAAEELKQQLERRSQQAMDKIARAEQEAVGNIRNQMVSVATQAVREIVRSELDGDAEDASIARAIRAIETQIH